MTFAPGGDELATVGADAAVRIWEPGADAPRSTLIGDTWVATAVAYHPDEELLATAGLDGVRLWDRASGRIQHRYPVDAATSVGFTPDGERLIAANPVRHVTIWSTVEPHAPPTTLYDAQPGKVTAHAVSPDGTLTAALSPERVLLPPPPPGSGGDDDTVLARSVIRIHDTATRRPVQVIVLPEDVSAALSFTADGESLDVFAADGRLRSWHIATGEQTRGEQLFDPLTSAVLAAVSEDRRWAAVVPHDPGRLTYEDGERITVVDLPEGRTVHKVWTGTRPVTALATSATAGLVAAGFSDGKVRLWELATGAERGSFQANRSDSVTALTFAPGGDRLAVAAGDTRWWTVNGEPAPGETLPGTAEREITALAVSPSGATVAAAGGGELTLHHTSTGAVIHSVGAWGGFRYATLQFDPTGRTLHASMTDMLMVGAVDVSYTDDPLRRLCDRIGRAVTVADWAAYVPDSERVDPGPACAG